MNGYMDRLVYTYKPKVTHKCKYNPKILYTRICVSSMLRTHARKHARTHIRTNLLVYIRMHTSTCTTTQTQSCGCVCERESVYVRECVC